MSAERRFRVAVIGAGVVGVASAVRIIEELSNVQVTLISEEVSPNTTGDGSAGLWGPYLCGNTPESNVMRWSNDTHRFLHALWKGGLAERAGVALLPMMRVTREPLQGPRRLLPFWADAVYGCQLIDRLTLDRLGREHKTKYTDGVQFVSFIVEPSRLLPYLMERFQVRGGLLERRKVKCFHELSHFDVVVNCTGLGARKLCKDDLVHPIRGQVARVEAPWINEVFLDESDIGNYVIPNLDKVILGGTHQENDYNTDISEEDSNHIFEGCSKIFPSLKNAQIYREWAGLRPGRIEVRLGLELTPGSTPVVHNYGHGGCGVTMCWGCAGDVVHLVDDLVRKTAGQKSKL